jgi:replication factor C large subunit
MEKPFCEKYRPQEIKELVGINKTVDTVTNWLKNWKTMEKKAILLHGPPGVGKTTLVTALAKTFNFELIELNASDFRKQQNIEEIIGYAVCQESLFFKSKIILLDEIDGIHGIKDRGGISAIIKIIKKTAYPIFLTANDIWKQSLATLRKQCLLVKMNPLRSTSVLKLLKSVVKKENADIPLIVLKRVAERSGGDLRSALNDVQAIINDKAQDPENVEELGERTSRRSIFDALKIMFKTKDLNTALTVFDNVDEDTDTILDWIVENVRNEYSDPIDILKAFNYLSRADVFRGRLIKSQYWRFIVYIRELMIGGVALAKREKYRKFVKYLPPSKIYFYGRSKADMKVQNELALKFLPTLHVSKKVFVEYYFPLFKFLLKKRIDLKKFGLEETEIKYLKKF